MTFKIDMDSVTPVPFRVEVDPKVCMKLQGVRTVLMSEITIFHKSDCVLENFFLP